MRIPEATDTVLLVVEVCPMLMHFRFCLGEARKTHHHDLSQVYGDNEVCDGVHVGRSQLDELEDLDKSHDAIVSQANQDHGGLEHQTQLVQQTTARGHKTGRTELIVAVAKEQGQRRLCVCDHGVCSAVCHSL